MALNGLFCADVPLRNYSLTHIYYTSRVIANFVVNSSLIFAHPV